jgi:hypothetical protein
MRALSGIAALPLVVLSVLAPPSAQATTTANLVDGTHNVWDISCDWTDGTTSANPPSILKIFRTTVNPPNGNLTCYGGTLRLNNDPGVSFSSGTVVDRINVTAVKSGVTCGYEATRTPLDNGSGGFKAALTSGDGLCPVPVYGHVTLVFH